jgi:hypothetical protein
LPAANRAAHSGSLALPSIFSMRIKVWPVS